jgi:hypothetical protein
MRSQGMADTEDYRESVTRLQNKKYAIWLMRWGFIEV